MTGCRVWASWLPSHLGAGCRCDWAQPASCAGHAADRPAVRRPAGRRWRLHARADRDRQVIARLPRGDDGGRRRRQALTRLELLTQRERDVLVEVGGGHSNAEIASTLHMSEGTAKAPVTRLFDKLSTTNRVQLAIVALLAGLVD
ncbi:LuxR C-terminal-related transcriptional regulator [Asanoa sp. NPDC049518]|uniref:helix-turn-helix transcriptional regulator n=1 Tax=unclassified Asanoa TaxID=2685164 RepID=UPI0034454241